MTDTYDPHTGTLNDTTVANTAAAATPFDDSSYTYDPSGNITSEADDRNGSQSETQCYHYNTLDELTEAWTGTDKCAADPSGNAGATVGDGIPGSAYWTSWGFNTLGERTTQTQHSTNTVTTYSYNTAQPDTLAATSTTAPSGTSSTSYTYDADGNTVSRDMAGGTQTLTWNPDGSLVSDAAANGTTGYVYDADGDLLVQNDTGTHQRTLYVFGEQIVLDTASGAITGTRFIPLPGGGEVVRTGGGTSYQLELTNQQGTADLTLSADLRSPQWRQFTPYGAARGTPPAAWPDTNGLLGKPTDSTSGLTTVGARQYDPATGMFLSVDPLLDSSDPLALNGYTYADDNPVTNSDPSGELIPGHGGGRCVGSSRACIGANAATDRSKSTGGGRYVPGYTPTPHPFSSQQLIRHNLFTVSPAPAPRPHPHAKPFTPQNPFTKVLGCDGPVEFKLGACAVEVKDVQAGLKASHITPSQLLFNLVLTVIPGGELLDGADTGADLALSGAGKLLPGGVRAARGIPGEAMDDLIEQTGQTVENDGNLANATRQVVRDIRSLGSASTGSYSSVAPQGSLASPVGAATSTASLESGVILGTLAFRLAVITIRRGWR